MKRTWMMPKSWMCVTLGQHIWRTDRPDLYYYSYYAVWPYKWRNIWRLDRG